MLGRDKDDDNVDSGEDDDENIDESDFDDMLQEHPMSNKKKIVYYYSPEIGKFKCDDMEEMERLESMVMKDVLEKTLKEVL